MSCVLSLLLALASTDNFCLARSLCEPLSPIKWQITPTKGKMKGEQFSDVAGQQRTQHVPEQVPEKEVDHMARSSRREEEVKARWRGGGKRRRDQDLQPFSQIIYFTVYHPVSIILNSFQLLTAVYAVILRKFILYITFPIARSP